MLAARESSRVQQLASNRAVPAAAFQVAEKKAAYAQLTAENEALKRKEKVLDKVGVVVVAALLAGDTAFASVPHMPSGVVDPKTDTGGPGCKATR
jgi:hypothetical protein